jgi:hypothetical protein
MVRPLVLLRAGFRALQLGKRRVSSLTKVAIPRYPIGIGAHLFADMHTRHLRCLTL